MKRANGITLVSLVITIIILIIVAGIGVNTAKKTIKQAKLEELRTNMLLIQAKAKEYVEEANFKMGISPDDAKIESVRTDVYENEAKLQKATSISAPFDVTDCYVLTEEALQTWGLDKIELSNGEYYLVKFDDDNATVEEIYNTKGIDNKYTLTALEE